MSNSPITQAEQDASEEIACLEEYLSPEHGNQTDKATMTSLKLFCEYNSDSDEYILKDASGGQFIVFCRAEKYANTVVKSVNEHEALCAVADLWMRIRNGERGIIKADVDKLFTNLAAIRATNAGKESSK